MARILLLLVLAIAVWKGYGYFSERDAGPKPIDAAPAAIPQQSQQSPSTPIDVSAQAFHCDGREYCSQMASRAEAEFFVRNCPSVKMDGDHDGIPCENDSRF
ncbi:MAG: excalibur calcium-binding domain-containing protein [Luteimonas sp.]